MSENTSSSDGITQSATVMVVRQSPHGNASNNSMGFEVLLLQRSHELQVAPGHWVFPGGAVEDSDRQIALAGEGDLDENTNDQVLRHAACREVSEETALVINKDDLKRYHDWVSPSDEMRRFFTRFYFYKSNFHESNGNQQLVVDGKEIKRARWLTPATAIAMHYDGRLKLFPPTYISLLWMARQATVQCLLNNLDTRTILQLSPRRLSIANGFIILLPGDSEFVAKEHIDQRYRHRIYLSHGRCTYLYDERLSKELYLC